MCCDEHKYWFLLSTRGVCTTCLPHNDLDLAVTFILYFFPFIKARRHLNTPSVQAIDRWLVASNGTQIN
jgi:hypothetical protein